MSFEITVGLTEQHGISIEAKEYPPKDVVYTSAESSRTFHSQIFKSHAKGNLHSFKGDDCDLLEAPLFPIHTSAPWIYTPAGIASAAAFSICGLPTPRGVRIGYLKHLLNQDNFKALIFKSQAGFNTLWNYGKIDDKRILAKSSILYPAIRKFDTGVIRKTPGLTVFLASGDFYRKGVANTVDAFELLQKERDDIFLRICSNDNDFSSGPDEISENYKERIFRNDAISIGAVSRIEMIEQVFPTVDVFVSPTMTESFGFALVEASAFGIPSIATQIHAIPEIIEHNSSGFLIPINQFNFIKKKQFYNIKSLDEKYHNFVTSSTFDRMKQLASDSGLREKMGQRALEIARTKFSFESRNRILGQIYRKSLSV